MNVPPYEGELLRRIDPKHRSLGQFFQEESPPRSAWTSIFAAGINSRFASYESHQRS
ncbi:MAG TPA: hypothetical protein VF088_17980 [Pyrinomonadaceae bacterium]